MTLSCPELACGKMEKFYQQILYIHAYISISIYISFVVSKIIQITKKTEIIYWRNLRHERRKWIISKKISYWHYDLYTFLSLQTSLLLPYHLPHRLPFVLELLSFFWGRHQSHLTMTTLILFFFLTYLLFLQVFFCLFVCVWFSSHSFLLYNLTTIYFIHNRHYLAFIQSISLFNWI